MDNPTDLLIPDQDGWSVCPCGGQLLLNAPTETDAQNYLDEAYDRLLQTSKALKRPIHLRWTEQWDEQSRALVVTPRMSSGQESLSDVLNGIDRQFPPDPFLNPLTLQPDSEYRRIMEFCMDLRDQGYSVCITSQIDDECLYQNDQLLPTRAVLLPHEWQGKNYRWYWRNSMDDYRDLRRLLTRDRAITNLEAGRPTVPEFEYTLTRADGRLARYSTHYFLVDNFMSPEGYPPIPARIGVSNVEHWQLL